MSEKIDNTQSLVADISGDILEEVEDYIIIDSEAMDDQVSAFTRRVFGDVTKQSAAKQVAVGGATGWISGYLLNKVGKSAALAVGSSVLLIQLAQYNGYITVDWTKVNKRLTKARAQAEREFRRNHKSYIHNVKRFYHENYFLASGFAGGFLFGFFI